ncbi:MAG: hypothetical protein M1483_07180 [Actinobacteria bacterium]|nr:hypothetical protein [Actinomycetota bacterium]
MKNIIFKFRIISVIATTAVFAAACGTSQAPPQAANTTAVSQPANSLVDVVVASNAKTLAAKTAEIQMSVSLTGVSALSPSAGPGSSSSSFLTASGAFNFTDHTGEMSMTLPFIAALTSMMGKSSANGPANDIIRFELIGSNIYMSMPFVTSIDGGKPWVEMSIPTPGVANSGGISGLFGGYGSMTPSNFLKILTGVSGQVAIIGHSSIDGVAVTGYVAHVNIANVLSADQSVLGSLGGSSTGLSSQNLSSLKQAFANTTVLVRAWIDAQGRVRHLAISIPMGSFFKSLASSGSFSKTTIPASALSTLSNASLTDVIDFSNFGVPVSITPPPASQVTSMAAVMSHLGSLPGLPPGLSGK